ncbi:MAG: AmmeMemoRadiSam system protein B [Sedimentisphaerales bacterium]|nr:AmmeMemoRadiSam system protein B [Sedimentisphaerales bacterium]
MSTWLRRSIPGAFILCVLLLMISCKKATPETSSSPQSVAAEAKGGRPPVKDVMRSTLAGTWYNADPAALRTEIAGYFEQVTIDPRDDVIGLILPHAGYKYSGRTAAHAIQSLGREYARVVVIGPTHRLPMEEMLSVLRATHYQSPLGEIPLDVEFIERLLTYPIFRDVPAAHKDEHSVQIEVPLLQYKLGEFKLVPIVAGQCTYETVERAGKILASLIDKDTLVVASSDFTHYGPQYEYVPFSSDIPENLKKLDMDAFAFISKKDPRGLLEYRRKTGVTICGYVPISILLAMLGDTAQPELVEYITSGALMNDSTNSVSYVSAAIHGVWQPAGPPAAQASPGALSQEDKKVLLSLARKAISYALDKQRMPDVADLHITPSEAMKAPRAAFVTLKKHGQLRGCIGDIFPQRPLHKSVIANAVYAAFADRRFPQLQKDECNQIRIEISALTPPSPVASAQEIRIGTDGMVLNKDGRSAVFLPQVAPEQGWDLETTLTHLSMKAGLAPDAWKQGASFQVFQAEVFGE